MAGASGIPGNANTQTPMKTAITPNATTAAMIRCCTACPPGDKGRLPRVLGLVARRGSGFARAYRQSKSELGVMVRLRRHHGFHRQIATVTVRQRSADVQSEPR